MPHFWGQAISADSNPPVELAPLSNGIAVSRKAPMLFCGIFLGSQGMPLSREWGWSGLYLARILACILACIWLVSGLYLALCLLGDMFFIRGRPAGAPKPYEARSAERWLGEEVGRGNATPKAAACMRAENLLKKSVLRFYSEFA